LLGKIIIENTVIIGIAIVKVSIIAFIVLEDDLQIAAAIPPTMPRGSRLPRENMLLQGSAENDRGAGA
jgi:hypothetical protein